MKSLIMFAILLVFIHTSLQPQNKKVFGEPGIFNEEFVYSVNWGFINLGKIVIQAYKDFQSEDSTDYILSLHVISNPFLPFVNINEYNEATVSIKDFFSKRYYGLFKNSSENVEINISYEKETQRNVYSLKDLTTNKIVREETFENIPPYLDGPSLFYFTRFHINSKKTFTVPTIVDGEIHKTNFNFDHPAEVIDIDAFEYPIRARKYTGLAQWKGGTSAGLSGEFKGWISDDEASVVLRAEVKVWVGSISIELEKWHKPGWKPQSYNYARVR